MYLKTDSSQKNVTRPKEEKKKKVHVLSRRDKFNDTKFKRDLT